MHHFITFPFSLPSPPLPPLPLSLPSLLVPLPSLHFTVEFVKDPQDVTANLGEKVQLHCERDPPGLFTWQHYLLNGSVWNIASDEPHR